MRHATEDDTLAGESLVAHPPHPNRIPLVMDRVLLTATLALALTLPAAAVRSQEPTEGSDFIRVMGEPWKVGEVRSYTFLFDRAPFGRETIRLDHLEGEREARRLRFSQTLVLDLRALGQEGSLVSYTSVQYERGRLARRYRAEDRIRERSVYSTYSRSSDRSRRLVLSLDLSSSPARMEWSDRGTSRKIPLPAVEGALLVDPLSMGHWERLFLSGTWRVGQVRTLDLLLPRGVFRFDYHLDASQLEPPAPERIRVNLKVEAKEIVEVFSIPISAFRCRIPELGYVLWVSGSGGILKFEDGRGLVVLLER